MTKIIGVFLCGRCDGGSAKSVWALRFHAFSELCQPAACSNCASGDSICTSNDRQVYLYKGPRDRRSTGEGCFGRADKSRTLPDGRGSLHFHDSDVLSVLAPLRASGIQAVL
jgi:hypothetical protein